MDILFKINKNGGVDVIQVYHSLTSAGGSTPKTIESLMADNYADSYEVNLSTRAKDLVSLFETGALIYAKNVSLAINKEDPKRLMIVVMYVSDAHINYNNERKCFSISDSKGNMLTSSSYDVEYLPDICDETKDDKSDDTKSNKKKDTFFSMIDNDPKYTCPTVNDGFCVKDSVWRVLCRNVEKKVNTMLVGETGSGKTSIVELISKRLGLPMTKYNMGSMRDAESALLGTHRIKDGNSVFDYAKFVYDIQKPGIILLDELSRPAPEVNNILFPVLDNDRTLYIPISGSGDMQEIKVHDDCVFIATANIGMQYTGTMAMDAALTNRFMTIELEYLDRSDEASLLISRCGIKKSDADKVAKVFSDIRSMYESDELERSVSTRESLMTASLIKDGMTSMEAMKFILVPMFEKNDRDKILAEIKKVY